MKSEIHYLMQREQAEIFLKREDLLPFSFGGNKLRIAAELFQEAEATGCDAIVSYGSPTSNLNRVVAQMAKAKDLPCTIVCKEEPVGTALNGARRESPCRKPLNLRLVEASGANIMPCRAADVRQTVEAALAAFRRAGRQPYYVYGNSSGSGNETVLLRAYVKAFQEIAAYEKAAGQPFSYLFLACGTGMTQAGLLLGQAEAADAEGVDGEATAEQPTAEQPAEIVGISVARARTTAEEGVRQKLLAAASPELFARLNSRIKVTDAYLAGGYGSYDESIEACIQEMTERFGLPLDPVYTGKAFFGMLQEIHRRKLRGRILFLHTGGLPIYFDYLAAHML